MAFNRFKDTDFVEQVHIFGLSNIHTFEPNIRLIFNQTNPRLTIYETPKINHFSYNTFKYRNVNTGNLETELTRRQKALTIPTDEIQLVPPSTVK